MGALAELIKLGIKTASKQVDEVVPKTLSRMRSDYTPSPIVDETTDVLTALGRSEDDIVKFKKENLLEGSEKEVYRNSKLEEQARALDEGLITLDEFKEARDIFKPRRTYGTVPKLYELFDILGSMGKSVKNKGIVGVNKNIKSGELVNTRFDVKAYENYGRYVVTVGKGNKVTGYAPTAILKNVKFAGNPSIEEASKRVPDIGEKSFNLAKGKRIEGGKKLGIKSPFATMEGKWQNMSPESTHKYAEDLMDAGKVNKYGETDKEWTEIGFDPASKSSFYNRSTGEPIFAADKVVQVGSMLLARGIKKPTKQQLKSLQFITKAGKEIEGYKEGGQVLPVIEKNIGGQVLEGLDGEYMRQRNSKEKLEGVMRIPQIQSRQYGGGLDDAYMTLSQRRNSAFAAPDATSAFASPISMGGLPTIYRDVGGGIGDDYEEAAGEYADMVSDAMAGDYTGADFGDEGGSYQKQMEAAMSVPSAQISDLAASPDLGYSTSEITAIREAQRAAAEKDEADRRIGYLTGTTRTTTDQRTSMPTKEEYEKSLNRYGYEPYQSTYLSDLINKGYDLKEAQSILASAMATPGGIQGMKNAFEGSYSYGGAAGTLLDLLERGTMQSLGIDDILKKNKKFMEEDRKKDLKDNPDLSEGFLDSVGLGGVSKIVDKITDAVSLQGEVSPRVNTAITEQVKDAGWDYTPVSSTLAKGMDYGISAAGSLVAPGLGAALKGLANITDTGKTIGTLTKDGMSFNVNITEDGGRLSINMPTVNYDEGNVSTSARQSRPVQQKAAASTTEDKPLTGIKALLAERDEPVSREASNKYNRALLDSLGYGNVNIG